ncbi:F-box domain, Leucine-rich repeat domain, L domain-like protein [Artemisia annua]|uniref:F-box domain, Leucine-rich repeat domain, L domain-like protein n=1 Tax=Artemisia annua TaxID=35608 RepID=A0A2U1KQZ2_ARTAN|nr:F-box domain, Leucine-rich repeat domain, L domain-like protein [Artemisia annua]
MLPPIRLCASKSDQQKAKNPKSVPKAKMPSPIILCASKADRQKALNHKAVPKVKASFKRWLDLPSDLATNILHRIGVIDILENAQKVCTTWRNICKEPAIWRVIHMDTAFGSHTTAQLREMCKNAVDRSQGQLVDISILGFCNNELLKYIADRASHLRRLEIACCYGDMNGTWAEALKKFPALEELSLQKTGITKEAIETIGRHCPLLKILKLNQAPPRYLDEASQNDLSIAIGTNLHELSHLELIGNSMTNIGIEVILDGCRHLESLDLRKCHYINLKSDLGKKCSRQIKYLKLPEDSLDGCPYIYENDEDFYDDMYPDMLCHCHCGLDGHDSDDDERWTEVYMEIFSP